MSDRISLRMIDEKSLKSNARAQKLERMRTQTHSNHPKPRQKFDDYAQEDWDFPFETANSNSPTIQNKNTPNKPNIALIAAGLGTFFWLSLAIGYIANAWDALIFTPPALGLMLTGVLAPIALLWLALQAFQSSKSPTTIINQHINPSKLPRAKPSISPTDIDAIGERSAAYCQEINEAAQAAFEKLKAIDSALEKRVAALQEKTGDLTFSVNTMKEALYDTAKDVDQVFTGQTRAMVDASKKAAQTLSKINKRSQSLQREGFTTAAKFIIESLCSISVDITRANGGKISEKMWKSFQGGESLVFIEYLNKLNNKNFIKKLSEKIAADNDFRTYTMRYIRQFEDLYTQAQKHDESSLLLMTIASSDPAKLYSTLARASNRESVIKSSHT